MAKVVKDTRNVMDVEEDLDKIQEIAKKETKVKKKKEEPKKKKSTKNKEEKRKNKSGKGSFIKEVKEEVSKIKWPSKKEMTKYSAATIGFIIFFALFFYVIDLIIALIKAGV